MKKDGSHSLSTSNEDFTNIIEIVQENQVRGTVDKVSLEYLRNYPNVNLDKVFVLGHPHMSLENDMWINLFIY